MQAPSAEKTSEFEQYVSGTMSPSVSTSIKQFGYDLFTRSPSSFAPVGEVPVGPDYVIGPGDEIKVSIWGSIDGQWTSVVDRDGTISLPKLGQLGRYRAHLQRAEDGAQQRTLEVLHGL